MNALSNQGLYTTSNRRWLGKGERHLDHESYSFLVGLVPQVDGRIVDANPAGATHKDALEKARRMAISEGRPWAAVVPINVTTSTYARELIIDWHVDVLIPEGRIKTTDHDKHRAATGSAIIVFYPTEGDYNFRYV